MLKEKIKNLFNRKEEYIETGVDFLIKINYISNFEKNSGESPQAKIEAIERIIKRYYTTCKDLKEKETFKGFKIMDFKKQ